MATATEQVVGLIPVVIAADIALRVVDRTFPPRRQSSRKRRPQGLLNHSLRL